MKIIMENKLEKVQQSSELSVSSKTVLLKELYTQHYPLEQSELKKVPCVQTEIFFTRKKYLDTEINNESINFHGDNKKILSDKPIEIEIAVNSENGKLSKTVTELTTTASGNLAIELDENVLALIEKKAQETSVLVKITQTDPSRFVVDFTSNDHVPEEYNKVCLRKSLSGTNLELLINHGFSDKLKENTILSGIDNALRRLGSEDIIKINKKTGIAACDKDAVSAGAYNSNFKHFPENPTDNYLLELEEIYAEGKSTITLKVQGQNGVLKNIQAPLTRTLSGNIALDIINICSFGEISCKAKELPILMTKSGSGTRLLDISCTDNANAILRRTPSGGILIVATNPVLKSKETVQKEDSNKTNNELFRVRVKSIGNRVTEPPAVLKSTPSLNYLIVLDKEYEKMFSQTLRDYIGDEGECFVEMHKTYLGDYFVTLDDGEGISDDHNALLIKSTSGHIKILVNEDVHEAKQKSPKKNSAMSTKDFSELLNKVPYSSKKNNKVKLQKTTLVSKKSNSESQLYDKVQFVLPNLTLINEPSSTLKRSSSGQYEVVLSKESKKALVNSLRGYLCGSHGHVPIKRNVSGKITITLVNNEDTSENGSLKITPSGNIFVTSDDAIIKQMSKEGIRGECSIDTVLSKHVIGSLKHPVNKAVTTTCNAKPDDCSCDATKCVCGEMQSETDKWFLSSLERKESEKLFQPQNCGMDWRKLKRNSKSGYKSSNSIRHREKCCSNGKKSGSPLSEKAPHIVIKPCPCRPVLEKNPRSTEECYVVEAVCPYHIDRYERVSNELLEIPGLCNKGHEDKALEPIDTKENNEQQDWNSLKFLPPQLPYFLRDISYP